MHPKKIKNIFAQKELDFLADIASKITDPINDDGSYIYEGEDPESKSSISKHLGRLQSAEFNGALPDYIVSAISEYIDDMTDKKLIMSNITYVEYNNKYGIPELYPHYDGDSSEIIVNFQLMANTDWQLGVGLELYDMEDNSALAFDGNEHIHWRPHKVFKDGEYVRMIFFRFVNKELEKDNSHLRYSKDNLVYKEVNEFRDSLNKF